MDRALTLAHIEAERRLRVQIAAAVARIWRGLPAYDRENVGAWLAAVLPTVESGKRASVALTDAYLARALNRRPLGVDVADIVANVRGGAAAEDVYTRPFVEVWTGLKGGAPWQAAVAAGLDRAISTAETDMQLAMRATATAIGTEDDGIYGFERVPDGNACELCLIASTQRYRTEDLMPIHNHCGCSVSPITEPTGRVINRDLYRDLKADGAMDRISRQRLKSRLDGQDAPVVQVREHGELGPVLTNSDHDFTLL